MYVNKRGRGIGKIVLDRIKSDVLPVRNIGGTGIYIPHKFTWKNEEVESTFDLERVIGP